MTTASDDPIQVRVGSATKAGSGGPHFLAPVGSGFSVPPVEPKGLGRGPLPPWRACVRKGLVLGGLIGGGFLLPPERNVPNLDAGADAERASFDVAEGFEVNLFAADPLLAKPTQINFDARGRLWVACSEAYPQIKPDQPANDKVVVLEDGDGDGVAEKAKVFAEGLLIPTGVEPGDGGAYVADGTELLHLKDTDGDGKADERRVVLSGFGTEDTHHILHTLRWGPDGALYFNQSIYIHSHIETPWGVQRLSGGGIWRFQPESGWLTVFARGWVNPWGHAFDRWGQSFVTDGAGGQGINHAIPGGSYVSAVGAGRTLPGLNPGSPKFCGAEILSGRHLPEDYRGQILTNDFRANNVRRFALTDNGSTFHSRPQPDLIRTRYQAFRPIDIKMGPDGAVYVADWFNPIINHGEVDFRDPRRDHTRGRIWRVTAKGRPLVDRPRLVDAPVPQLLDSLKSPEDWTRHFAKRVLKERGRAEVEPALIAWIKGLDPSDPQVEHHRLEALWVYESLGVVAPELLTQVACSTDPHARSAAVRVTEHWLGRIDDPFGRLALGVADLDPRVRLEAVRALGHAPEARGAEIALRALDRPMDKTLDHALWATLRDLRSFWHQALAEGRFDYGGDTRRLVYALEAVGSGAAIRPLVEALRAGVVDPAQQDQARNLIASLGGPGDLAILLNLALDPAISNGRRAGLLAALADAAERRKVVPEGDLARVGRWLDPASVAPPSVQAEAVRAIGAWKLEPLRDRVEAIAGSDPAPSVVRSAAILALAAFGGDQGMTVLDALTRSGRPIAERWEAAAALSRLDLGRGAGRAVALLGASAADSTSTAAADPSPLFEAFLGRQGGGEALASALADGSPPPSISPQWAEAGVRVATRMGRPVGSPLVLALNRAGGLSTGVVSQRSWSAAERASIVLDVQRRGDPARGEAIFRRNALQCLNCHAIAGAGGRVGPGLESLGASAPVDYLVDSLVEPNKAVKEGYHALTVATSEGRVYNGIKVGQTDLLLLLRDSDDREISVPFASIDERKDAGSLMPAGLVDGLTRAELVDLVRFLSELGKLGPYAVSPQVRPARRWEVAASPLGTPPTATPPPLEAIVAGADPSGPSWSPTYSTVAGVVPLADLPTTVAREGRFTLARTGIEVSTPGLVRLAITPQTTTVWVDGRRVSVPSEAGIDTGVDVDLTAGPHLVTLAVPIGTAAPSVRLEIRDAAGSPAQARPVLGK